MIGDEKMSNSTYLKYEDKLILKCAQSRVNKDDLIKIKQLFNQNLDWEYIIKMVTKHRLRSLLFWNINKICPEEVPMIIKVQLENFYYDNVRKNLFKLGELLEILKILESYGIVTVPYKGPVLAINGYGNLSLREFSDMDIYVDKKNVSLAKKILISNGYKPHLQLDTDIESHYIQSQREFKFFNKEKDVNIEIHWNVVGLSISFPCESSFPLEKLVITRINGRVIKSFIMEDLILILSVHVAGHMWERLSWICDINELIRGADALNWDMIIRKARHLAVERILYINLYLAHELFDLELPSIVMNNIMKDATVFIICKDIIMNIFNKKSFNILSKMIMRFKIREKRNMGFSDVWTIITVPNSKEWVDFEKKGDNFFNYAFKRPLQIISRLKSNK